MGNPTFDPDPFDEIPDLSPLEAILDGLQPDPFESIRTEVQNRVEQEVLAAWRAGYDRVHVYDKAELGERGLSESFALTRLYLPGHEGGRRPDPPDLIYRYSYELNSVPDSVFRAALRGEL